MRYGDWSLRFGSINGARTLSAIGNDTHAQLFGQLVFLGRSIVIHGMPAKKRRVNILIYILQNKRFKIIILLVCSYQ